MKDLMSVQEEWRSIPEFDGYEVSSLGRVRGKDRLRKIRNGVCPLKGKELKQIPNRKGYPEVRFRKEGNHNRVVHRLVAKAFIPNPNNHGQVNHTNGIKTDNRAANLEWVTGSENMKHAYRLGLQPSRAGENNSKTKLTDAEVTNLKVLYNQGQTIAKLSEQLNIPIGIIRNIIYGRTWKCNKTQIVKRDDRKFKKKEDIAKMIKTKYSKGAFAIAVVQLSKTGEQLNIFRSINNASVKTGIPRKSIEAVVNKKRFCSLDGTKTWYMTEAGGFSWKKVTINQIEQYL